MKQYLSIKIQNYLQNNEINDNLKGIEYILMVSALSSKINNKTLHVSIFLNTQEQLPKKIQEEILQKFCNDYNFFDIGELLSQLMYVGFANTSHDTAMPMLLLTPQDKMSIANTVLHVIDFIANSNDFKDTVAKGLTGWSYVKE